MELDAVHQLTEFLEAWLVSRDPAVPPQLVELVAAVDTLCPTSPMDDLPVLIAISMLRVNLEGYVEALASGGEGVCGRNPVQDYSCGLPGPRVWATARLLRRRFEERRVSPWGHLVKSSS